MSSTVNQQGIPPGRVRALATDLLNWYGVEARDLPWRQTRDPYAIWVSEVMLQQTRVEVVVNRWGSFLERFPDIASLAKAPQADVLAEWAGLGYYRRVRSLHRAACELADRGVDELPRSSAELRLLPGFGAYTAGAVASIAFGERVPAVDGNVERVFARLLALSGDPARGTAKSELRAWATAMLDRADPAELNQALMELGATVCTPRSPSCGRCPWSARCRAHAMGAAGDYPRRPAPRPAINVLSFVAVARDSKGRMLFRRRADGGHNAGLWELPSTAFLVPDAFPDPATELRALGLELDREWEVQGGLTRVKHSITHHRITAVAHAVADQGRRAPDPLAWLDSDGARKRGLTAAAGKILERLPTLI
jgi:A/G-specific adenine glycosylase